MREKGWMEQDGLWGRRQGRHNRNAVQCEGIRLALLRTQKSTSVQQGKQSSGASAACRIPKYLPVTPTVQSDRAAFSALQQSAPLPDHVCGGGRQ